MAGTGSEPVTLRVRPCDTFLMFLRHISFITEPLIASSNGAVDSSFHHSKKILSLILGLIGFSSFSSLLPQYFFFK